MTKRLWEPKCGHASIWYDNWTQKGAIQYYLSIDYIANRGLEDVHQLMNRNGWNINLLNEIFPEDLCDDVVNNLGKTGRYEDGIRHGGCLKLIKSLLLVVLGTV